MVSCKGSIEELVPNPDPGLGTVSHGFQEAETLGKV